MNKVFVVRVRDWSEDFRMVDFSFHRTQFGAEQARLEAIKRYHTNNAFVEEMEVKD